MNSDDLAAVAPYVVKFYDWLAGHPGGESPEELMAKPLSTAQRKLLQELMDDTCVVWGITAPLRNVLKSTEPASCNDEIALLEAFDQLHDERPSRSALGTHNN